MFLFEQNLFNNSSEIIMIKKYLKKGQNGVIFINSKLYINYYFSKALTIILFAKNNIKLSKNSLRIFLTEIYFHHEKITK